MAKEEILTAKEVAAIMRVHEDTVLRWAKKGILRPMRFGLRTLRFKRSELLIVMERMQNYEPAPQKKDRPEYS